MATTITVNCAGDTGGVTGKYTLREALNYAATLNDDVSIVFDATVFTGTAATISLASSLQFSDTLSNFSVSIDGTLGDGQTVVINSATGTDQLFATNGSAANWVLSFSNLELNAGSVSGSGGAIFVQGNTVSLSVENLTVSGGSASGGGGGIEIQSDDTVSVTVADSTFSNLSAPGQYNYGGAIDIYAANAAQVDLSITGSTFTDCSAGNGGAISLDAGSNANEDVTVNVTIESSSFVNNTATNSGGAVRLSASGGDYNVMLNAVVENSTFANNSGDDGGAVKAAANINGGTEKTATANVTVVDSTITGNASANGSGALKIAASEADTDSAGVVHFELANSVIVNNSLKSGGSAAADIAVDVSKTSKSQADFDAVFSTFGSYTGIQLDHSAGNQILGDNLPGNATLGDLFETVTGGKGAVENGTVPVNANGLLTHTGAIVGQAEDGTYCYYNDGSWYTISGLPVTGTVPVLQTDQSGATRLSSLRTEGAAEIAHSSITVDTLEDVIDASDGKTSLREALIAANAASGVSVIGFASTLSGGTIALTSDLPETTASGSIYIIGDLDFDDTADITIDGGSLHRLFTVSNGNTLVLNGLILKNAYASSDGGAVSSAGNLEVYNCTVTGTISGGSGAIYSSGTLKVGGNSFSGNRAEAGAGDLAFSGSELVFSKTGDEIPTLNLTGAGTTAEAGTAGEVRLLELTVTGDGTTAELISGQKYSGGLFTFLDGKADATLLRIDDGATLSVQTDQLDELLAAKTLAVNGTIQVLGGDVSPDLIAKLSSGSIQVADGGIYNVAKLDIASGVTRTIAAQIIRGIESNVTVKIGKGASLTLAADTDLWGGKNTVSVLANASLILSDDYDLRNVSSLSLTSGATFVNMAKQTVQGWTTVTVGGGLTTANGSTTISLGSYCRLTADSIAKSTLGGSNTLKIGKASEVNISGGIDAVKSLSLSASGTYKDSTGTTVFGTTALTVGGSITGIVSSSSISTGARTSLTVAGTIDLGGGKNTMTVGANSSVVIAGAANITTLKLLSGSVYKKLDGTSVRGWTAMTVNGDYTPSASTNTISVGSYATLRITGEVRQSSLGSSGVKISVGSNSLFAAGRISALSSLTLSSGAQYTDAGEKVQGKTRVTITGSISGTESSNAVSTGSFSQFEVIGDVDLGGGSNTISIGGKSVFTARNVLNVKKFTLASGGVYTDVSGTKQLGRSEADLDSFSGANGSCSITLGSFARLSVSGAISTPQLGGSYTVKIGANATLEAGGGIESVKSLSLTNGSKYTDETGVKTQGVTNFSAASVVGTAGNDTVTLGNFTHAEIAGDLDFGDGSSDKLTIGQNSELRLNGTLSGLDQFTLGKNSVVEASTEAAAAMIAAAKTKIDSTAKIYNIGAVGIASSFTDITTENVDDNLVSSTSELDSGANGWLSDYESGEYFSGYSDTVDCFTLAGVTDSLDKWQIEGAVGSLKVGVWATDGSSWAIRSEVTETDGVWDLSSVSLEGATGYRVVVEIADDAAKDVYGYQVTKIA